MPGPLRRTPALAGPPMASRSPARRVQGRPRAMCVPRPGAVAAPARPMSPGETPKPSVHTPAKSKGGGGGDERHGGPGGGLCCFPTGPSTLGKESPAAPTLEWPSSCDGSRMTCRQELACDRVSAWGWGVPGPDTEGSSGGDQGRGLEAAGSHPLRWAGQGRGPRCWARMHHGFGDPPPDAWALLGMASWTPCPAGRGLGGEHAK